MNEPTYILGVESSCDETAAAIVADGEFVLSNVVSTQIDMHARFGGVVPEIASRAHIEAINSVIDESFSRAGVKPSQIKAVAVTCEPGLIGSLLVGLMAAKTLSWAWNIPLIGVNHVYAHAYAAALRLAGQQKQAAIEYPAVALICSGGHTALYRVKSPLDMELMGTTIDDAAGEAFDKVASILGLGYPGGPIVEKVARDGNPAAVNFPRALLEGQSLDFSFSGLKTAVLYHVNGLPENPRRKDKPQPQPTYAGRGKGSQNMTPQEIADVAAGFQAAVIDVLRIKLRRAVNVTGAKAIIIGGGVSANSALRQAAGELAGKMHCRLCLPAMEFCVDNGAMIAGLGYHYLLGGRISELDLEARATVRR